MKLATSAFRQVELHRYEAHGIGYRHIPDAQAAKDAMVRVVDESNEDYLYEKARFVFVDFPPAVKRKILALESAA